VLYGNVNICWIVRAEFVSLFMVFASINSGSRASICGKVLPKVERILMVQRSRLNRKSLSRKDCVKNCTRVQR
jgi:hypothetical protein